MPVATENDFFTFILQRQAIWHKKSASKEEPPWTEDNTLQKYKILNVYRELDKGTRYIVDKLKNIGDRKKILLNVVFYRFFNRFELYENLEIKPFGEFNNTLKEQVSLKLDQIKKSGKPIFNDAYLIAGKQGEEKHASVLNSLIWLNDNYDMMVGEIDKAKTPENSFEAIKKIPLVGNFLAYEIWTDLTYFDFFKQKWTDNDFVNIGPGASWGLRLIYGGEKKLSKRDEVGKILYLHKIQKEYLNNKKWLEISNKNAFSNNPFLSLRNIEHSLCEFRKYWNLKNGKGKKRYYKLNHPSG